MSDGLHLTLEFVRTRKATDPYAFSSADEEYLLRSEDGYGTVVFPWAGGLLEDLRLLQVPGGVDSVATRLGHRLRDLLGAANWREQERRIEEAIGRGQRVDITIRSEAAELYAIPWELLPLRASGRTLGEIAGVLLHYEWPQTRAPPMRASDPASRAIAVAWSDGGGAVPSVQHIAAIASAAAAGDIPFDPALDVIAAASAERLAEHLERHRPAILHVLCHGMARPPAVGLALSGVLGEQELVGPEHLRRILAPHTEHLRAVVLCACRTADSGGVGGHVGSLAQSAHRAGLACVVASRFPLSIAGSLVLAERFYRGLLVEGLDVGAAFLSARRALGPRGGVDWASIQLHCRADDRAAAPLRTTPPTPPTPPVIVAVPAAAVAVAAAASKAPSPDKLGVKDEAAAGVARRIRVAVLHFALAIDGGAAGMEPEETMEVVLEALPAFRDICKREVEALGGKIVDENEGGGVLACFGHPVRHEDDSARAVRAALHVVQATARLSSELVDGWGAVAAARVGVHSGRVIENADQRVDIHAGSVHQVAVALQQAAPAGAVLLSQDIKPLVEGFFHLEAHGAGARVHRVVEDLGITSRFQAASVRGLGRLVGRERELALILARWRGAVAGRGGAMLIVAEPGVGKSRLLEEVRKQIGTLAHRRLECSCSPYQLNTSLYLLGRLLRVLLDFTPTMTPEACSARLALALSRIGAPLEEFGAPFAELLGLPPPERVKDLPPRRKRELLLEGATALLVAAAEERPVLLVIEDLHWVDPSSEEWLGALLSNLGELPVMVLASARPEYTPPAAWQSSGVLSSINLTSLDRGEVLELIHQVTGGRALPVELSAEIFAKTDGNPLFVEDLTRMVLDAGLVEERDGSLVLTRPFHALAVPATLEEVLTTRLEGLAAARSVAQVGAAIGREFTFELHQAVCKIDGEELRARLTTLVDSGLVTRQGLLRRAKFVFKHALVREAIHDSILVRERRRYHLRIAEIIEESFAGLAESQPELLAHHYQEGGKPDRAVKYWELAARQSMARCAGIETLRHTANALKALEAMPEGDERRRIELRLHLGQGPALLSVKGWAAPELGASAERAKQLSSSIGGSVLEHFRITRGLWGYYMVSAQGARSLDSVAEMRAMAEQAQSVDFRLEADATACDSWFWLGRPDRSAAHGQACLDAYVLEEHHVRHSLEYGEDPSSICYCYTAISLWLLGRPAEAQRLHERAAAELHRYTHHFSRGFLLNGLAWYGCHTGAPDVALRWGEQLAALANEHEFPPWLAIARTQTGWARGMLGEVDAGVSLIRAGLDEWRSAGAVVTTLLNYTLLVEVLRRAGRLSEALDVVELGLAEHARSEEQHRSDELLRHRGELLVALRGPAALAEAEAAIAGARTAAAGRGVVAHELRAALSLATLPGRAPGEAELAAVRAAAERFAPGSVTRDLQAAAALLAGHSR